MGRLEGKVAIITGASSGMGKSMALRFAEAGAQVVISARRADRLEETAQAITNNGGTVLQVVSDVSKQQDWQRIVEETMTEFGQIDVLVNNAGVGGDPITGCIGEGFDSSTWEYVFGINVFGSIFGVQEVYPHMKKRKTGSIINIVSIASICAMGGPTAYTTSKGAMLSFTRAMAAAGAPDNIRVNSILPGIIDTEMTAAIVDEGVSETQTTRDVWKRKTKLNYFGDGDDIAYAALFLASDESKYVTGTEIVVDGGFVID
jgi:NAD(P)-dependent dehydrogenase (short-subunit alcohol dehydrogenase family)